MAKDNQQFLAIRPRRMRKDEFLMRPVDENLSASALTHRSEQDDGQLARIDRA